MQECELINLIDGHGLQININYAGIKNSFIKKLIL